MRSEEENQKVLEETRWSRFQKPGKAAHLNDDTVLLYAEILAVELLNADPPESKHIKAYVVLSMEWLSRMTGRFVKRDAQAKVLANKLKKQQSKIILPGPDFGGNGSGQQVQLPGGPGPRRRGKRGKKS
jgi:hypothetical protein